MMKDLSSQIFGAKLFDIFVKASVEVLQVERDDDFAAHKLDNDLVFLAMTDFWKVFLYLKKNRLHLQQIRWQDDGSWVPQMWNKPKRSLQEGDCCTKWLSPQSIENIFEG